MVVLSPHVVGVKVDSIATVLAIFNSRHNHSQGRPNGRLTISVTGEKCKVSLHPVLNFFTLSQIARIAKIFITN